VSSRFFNCRVFLHSKFREAVAERAVRPVSRTREGNMKIEKTKPKKSISEVVRLAGCLIAVV